MAVFEEQVVPLGGARVERHARAIRQHCRGQEDVIGPTLCVKKAQKKKTWAKLVLPAGDTVWRQTRLT